MIRGTLSSNASIHVLDAAFLYNLGFLVKTVLLCLFYFLFTHGFARVVGRYADKKIFFPSPGYRLSARVAGLFEKSSRPETQTVI